MCSNSNDSLMRCLICANANDCPPADVARLFSADDLLQHIYAHLNYRPHKCNQCAYATSSPSELIRHSQQTTHYQLTLYNAENTFLKEICQDIFEKCKKRRDTLVTQQCKTFVDGVHCSQSSSPIPSLNSSSANQREEPTQQQQMNTFDGESKMAQKFAMQMNSLSTPNSDNLPAVPRELQKAVNECILGVSEVFASTPTNFKPTDFGLFESTKKELNCTSYDQRKCILCGNISNSNTMREYHSNTHLNLPLYGCRLCADEFTKYGNWRRHMKDQHQQRNTVKYIKLEANWGELRNAMREMFVPIGGPTNLDNWPTTNLSNNTLGEGRTRQNEASLTSSKPRGTTHKQQHSTPIKKSTVPHLYTEFTIKTEHIDEAEERSQNDSSESGAKKMRTLSKVQCAECDEILPDTEMSRLHHTNVKHLNLCLYKCHLCYRQFTSTSNGLGCCVNHIKSKHPGEMLPYDEQLTMDDLAQKMVHIRARAAELFALTEGQ